MKCLMVKMCLFQIFRSLLKEGHRPSLNAFNLLLRVLRDCRFADDFQLLPLSDIKNVRSLPFDKVIYAFVVYRYHVIFYYSI